MSVRAKRGYLAGAVAAAEVFLCLAALLSLPKTAGACTCAPAASPAEALAGADAVFAGEAVAISPLGRPPYRLSSTDPVAVEFRVSRVWKGPRRETLIVETEFFEMSCGYEFKKGRKYIVYTWEGARTGLCTRTAPAWMAFADFVALGPGRPPESTPNGGAGGGGACSAPESSVGSAADVSALVLLAGAVALSIRRRTRL